MSDQLQTARMRAALQGYLDALNRNDADAVLALYNDHPTVEDPVGSPPLVGREAVEAFYRKVASLPLRLELAAPIRASHGTAAAMAFDVLVGVPGQGQRISVIDVMTFDADGRIASMKAYWGPEDATPL